MDGINAINLEKLPFYIETSSDEETRAIGEQLGQTLPPRSILCFFGDLGAGKTTLIKGITSAATDLPADLVNSPTFTLLNIYTGKTQIYHFDLYRLHDAEDFLNMGFEEYLEKEGICCIEWSERIESLLPKETIKIVISHLGEERRGIHIARRAE